MNKRGSSDYSLDMSRLLHLLMVSMVVLVMVLAGVIAGFTTYSEYLAHYFIPESDKPANPVLAEELPAIVDGVDTESGLIAEGDWEIVRANCTSCHTASIITQNKQTRDGWEHLIHWMQETQGLWDLGKNEPLILDYLATYYAPEETGRRKQLQDIEWYILDLTTMR